MQYVDLIYVYSVEWLLLPSNMLLPHIPAVFIAIFFVYLLVFLWMKHSKSTLSHLKVHHIVANCSHHVVEEIIEFIPPERFPAGKLCLSWQPREVSTAGARTRPNYLLRCGGHCKNTTVHLMNPEESASNSSIPRSLL